MPCAMSGCKGETMDNQTLQYRSAETMAACPIPADKVGAISIQISTGRGKTKWLGITPEEFRRIELVLFGASVEGE